MAVEHIEILTKKMTEKGFSDIEFAGMTHDKLYLFNATRNGNREEIKASGIRNIIFVRRYGEWVVI